MQGTKIVHIIPHWNHCGRLQCLHCGLERPSFDDWSWLAIQDDLHTFWFRLWLPESERVFVIFFWSSQIQIVYVSHRHTPQTPATSEGFWKPYTVYTVYTCLTFAGLPSSAAARDNSIEEPGSPETSAFGKGNVQISTDQCFFYTRSCTNSLWRSARAEFGLTVRPLIYCGGGFCATFRLGEEPSVARLLRWFRPGSVQEQVAASAASARGLSSEFVNVCLRPWKANKKHVLREGRRHPKFPRTVSISYSHLSKVGEVQWKDSDGDHRLLPYPLMLVRVWGLGLRQINQTWKIEHKARL